MVTYAIVQTGGKQYQVTPGDVIDVERLEAEVGATVELGDVRMISGAGDLMLGVPQVAGAHVVAEVQEQRKGPKLIVFKYKAKKHYRKKTGHRQQYTRLVISEIIVDGRVLAKVEERPPRARREAPSPAAIAEAPDAPEEDMEAAEAAVAEPEAAADEPASEETEATEHDEAEEAPVEAPPEPEDQETRRDGT